ncbi:drug/metabolite transporter (DMT)-like permease [Chryseobacterium sp. SLBN-27]|nr:drug/metabolite transporter (DMT)-like permease [Chryseobacterium sp. SLBN-27]
MLAAFTGNFIPMFLFPIAETEVSSSIAGIVNSMMPIFVIIVGALIWKFGTTGRQITGTLISFTGVCLLAFGGDAESGTFKLIPILLLLLATLCYAVSTTTVKSKLMDISSTVLSAFVFTFVLFLPSLIALIFTGFFSTFSLDRNHLTGLMFVSLLSIFGTGIGDDDELSSSEGFLSPVCFNSYSADANCCNYLGNSGWRETYCTPICRSRCYYCRAYLSEE